MGCYGRPDPFVMRCNEFMHEHVFTRSEMRELQPSLRRAYMRRNARGLTGYWHRLPDGKLGAGRPWLLGAIFCMGITFGFFTLAALIAGQWFAVLIFGLITALSALAFKTVRETR